MQQGRRQRVAAALLAKYQRMRELRDELALGPGRTVGDVRLQLRAFAAAWPGALKELDSLPTEEIDRRVAACAACAADAAALEEPWIAWSARYHELMRAALAIRRGETASIDDATPDPEFVRAVQRPRHGRLNVVVFTELGREFDLPPRTIWDTLFPPRGTAPRDYRR